MRTLFLGSYGFGNLGDELCLIEAMTAFPSTEAIAFSVDPDYTKKCTGVERYIQDRSEILRVNPDRIVLGGGGVGFFPSIRDSLHWMRDGWKRGAQCHIHNIGVANMDDLGWLLEDELVVKMLGDLSSCSVRDDISRYLMRSWPVPMHPAITLYPERTLPADKALLAEFNLKPPILGISIMGTRAMKRALEANTDRVSRYLQRFSGWSVMPIVSTVHGYDPEEDDIEGFEFFRKRFLRAFEVVGKQMLDRKWLRANLTPLRLKGIIGALTHLLSQRKHNVIHAVGTEVPMTGIFPGDDDSIMRIYYSLRNHLPISSDVVALPAK